MTADRQFLNDAIKGESVVVQKQTLFNEERVRKLPTAAVSEAVYHGKSNGGSMVADYWRNKLVSIMEQLQDIGVKSHQHIKRPYLFTGSWMEGVSSVEQLYDRIRGLTANEAMLRLFNVLQPFEGELPREDKDDAAISHFYGEYYNFDIPKEGRNDLSAIGSNVIEQSKIGQIQSALELANQKNDDQTSKIEALMKDARESEKIIADLKARTSELDSLRGQLSKLQDSVRMKESDLLSIKKQRDEAENRLKEEAGGKETIIATLQKDLQDRDGEISKLRKENTATKTQLKVDRI